MYHPVPSERSKQPQPYYLLVEAVNVIVSVVVLVMTIETDKSDATAWAPLTFVALSTLGMQFSISLIIFTTTLSPDGCFKGCVTQKGLNDWRGYQFHIVINNAICVAGLALYQHVHIYLVAALCILRVVIYMPLIMLNEDMFSTPSKKDATGEILEDEISHRRQFRLYLAASVADFLCLLGTFLATDIMGTHLWSTLAILFFTIISRTLHAYYLHRRPDVTALQPLLVFSLEMFVANAGIWMAIFLWPLKLQ